MKETESPFRAPTAEKCAHSHEPEHGHGHDTHGHTHDHTCHGYGAPEHGDDHSHGLFGHCTGDHGMSKKLRLPLVLGNLAIGIGGLLIGDKEKLMALVADGIHNIGDAATYFMNLKALEALNPQRLRRLGALAMVGGAAFALYKSGTSLAEHAEPFVGSAESEDSVTPWAIAAALGSVAISLGPTLYFMANKGWHKTMNWHKKFKELTGPEKDLFWHLTMGDSVSSVSSLASTLAVASGATGARTIDAAVGGISALATGLIFGRVATNGLLTTIKTKLGRNVAHEHDHTQSETNDGPKHNFAPQIDPPVAAKNSLLKTIKNRWQNRKRKPAEPNNTKDIKGYFKDKYAQIGAKYTSTTNAMYNYAKNHKKSAVSIGVVALSAFLAYKTAPDLFNPNDIATAAPGSINPYPDPNPANSGYAESSPHHSTDGAMPDIDAQDSMGVHSTIDNSPLTNVQQRQLAGSYKDTTTLPWDRFRDFYGDNKEATKKMAEAFERARLAGEPVVTVYPDAGNPNNYYYQLTEGPNRFNNHAIALELAPYATS